MLHRTCCCPPFQCFSKFQSIRYVDAARPGQLYNSWFFVGEDATATCRQVGWGGESLNPDESWCWNWSSLNTTGYVIWMTPEIHTRQASVSCTFGRWCQLHQWKLLVWLVGLKTWPSKSSSDSAWFLADGILKESIGIQMVGWFQRSFGRICWLLRTF